MMAKTGSELRLDWSGLRLVQKLLPSSPDEGLEGGALGVDAERNPFALLVLRDEAMDQFWNHKHHNQLGQVLDQVL